MSNKTLLKQVAGELGMYPANIERVAKEVAEITRQARNQRTLEKLQYRSFDPLVTKLKK